MRKDNLNTKLGSSVLDRNDAAGTLKDFYRPTAPDSRRVLAGVGRPTPIEFPDDLQASDDFHAWDGDRDASSGGSFMRNPRRGPIKKGWIPVSKASRVLMACGALVALGGVVAVVLAVRSFLLHDSRFRIESSSSIHILGNSHVTRPELLSTFGEDIGRNIFFVPLEQRRAELEELPWVERATVMRLLPDRLRVSVVERTPVAFVRQGSHIGLVDAHGVMLEMPSGGVAGTATGEHYSFPVLLGISANEPFSTREARMKIYQRFVADLDSTGEKVSRQLSEVDLSEPEDVRALLFDKDSDVLVHFGDSDFLDRYHIFQSHLPDWRRQYPRLASVDMRYPRQVVLEMQPGSGLPSVGSPAVESGKAVDQTGKPDAKHGNPAGGRRMATVAHPSATILQPPAKKASAAGLNGVAETAIPRTQVISAEGKPATLVRPATLARPATSVRSAPPPTASDAAKSASAGTAGQTHAPAQASKSSDPLDAADATLETRSAKGAPKSTAHPQTGAVAKPALSLNATGHTAEVKPAVVHPSIAPAAPVHKPASEVFQWTPKAAGKHSAAHPLSSAAQTQASGPATGKASSTPAAQREQTQ